MADNEREDAANKADDNEDNEKNKKNDDNEANVGQRPPVKKAPESQSAPAPGDDIIIK